MALLWFVLLIPPHPPAWAASAPFEESARTHSWLSFNKPSKRNPADQLRWAQDLEAAGKSRKAARAYRALVTTWPGSSEAPHAQMMVAFLLDKRGRAEEAFDEYQNLVTRYTGGYSYQAVVRRQFDIARQIMDRRRGRMLVFGGFKAPERAVPLLEKVVQNAPGAPFAPEAQYLIGRAYELSEQLELAVVAYMSAQHRYPDSPWAGQASMGRARALVRLSEESPNDEEALDQAWAAVIVFLTTFPQSDDAPVAAAYRDSLIRRRAKAAYDKASFYDLVAKRPAAAWQSYDIFVRQFPNSEWTPIARARMDALAPHVETANEN